MSTYFSVFDCLDCRQRVPVGFVGEMNVCPIFCAACQDSFTLSPPAGQLLLQTELAHDLLVPGKKEVVAYSKKGRVKKLKQQRAMVKSGVTVPVSEDIRESGGQLFLTYTPVWDQVPCPSCGCSGRLLDFRTYLRQCPACGSQNMQESDL